MSDKSNAGSGSEAGEDFEEAYEVEEIRDKQRGEDDEWLYYVKWVGWESDTNTWEPKAHLVEAKEKLEEFERKWRRRQDDKHERRRREKEERRRIRREREMKAAARYKMPSDDEGSYGGYDRGSTEKKKSKPAMSSSDSDSGGEKDDEKRKEKRKKREEERERRRAEKEKKREEEKKRQPKFFRDIKPEKILGVTTDPGELYFYIKWEGDKAEPGLIKAKEAYNKIPHMCLKFYEKHLVWDKMAPKLVSALAAENSESKTDQKTEGDSEAVKKETSADKDNSTEAAATSQETKKDSGDELDDLPAPVPADA